MSFTPPILMKQEKYMYYVGKSLEKLIQSCKIVLKCISDKQMVKV